MRFYLNIRIPLNLLGVYQKEVILNAKKFPGDSDSKETAYSVGDLGSIPGLGRSPREWNSYPLQYSVLENSTDRGA